MTRIEVMRNELHRAGADFAARARIVGLFSGLTNELLLLAMQSVDPTWFEDTSVANYWQHAYKFRSDMRLEYPGLVPTDAETERWAAANPIMTEVFYEVNRAHVDDLLRAVREETDPAKLDRLFTDLARTKARTLPEVRP